MLLVLLLPDHLKMIGNLNARPELAMLTFLQQLRLASLAYPHIRCIMINVS